MATVLWIGDGGCHTGFARVTHAIGDRLVERGHDVHVLATNYKGDYWPTKVKMYVPNSKLPGDYYGRSRIIEMLAKVEPDVVVMLNNPGIVLSIIGENAYDKDKILLQYRPLLAYMPIDGDNLPKRWDILEKITRRVAMSKHGQLYMPEAPVIYHGVDSDRFRPVSPQNPITTSTGIVCKTKADCKAAFDYPRDSFLVLRVDRNDGRKDYGSSWKALVPVMKRHTDIIAHFHCQVIGEGFGTDLRTMWSRDPETEDRFRTPEMVTSYFGYEEVDLITLYNAADLFLSTSRGEGFGLTIAEALACGTPVIAQNVSAIPEVVGPGGALIDPDREITVPSGDDQWLADIGAFTEAIEHAYLSRGWRRDKGLAGREHVVKTFRWDDAADGFHAEIEALASQTTDVAPLVGAAG